MEGPSEARWSLTLRACNTFIVLYVLDASLSVLDELLAAAAGGHPLRLVRDVVGYSALLASMSMYVWMALSPRPPKRILVPPIVIAFWCALGALPFAVTAPASASAAATVLQGVGAWYLLLAVRRASGGHWLLSEESVAGPSFRLRTSLGFVTANIVLWPICLAALLSYSIASYIEKSSLGFVYFDTTGINLADRRYTRDDRVIRLIGMMHIGEQREYQDLIASFSSANTVVLAEGVSDNRGLLGPFGYDGVATALGLDVQPRIEEVLDELDAEKQEGSGGETTAREWPQVQVADLDVGDFAPSTIEFLNRVGRVWTARGSGERLRELFALVRDPKADEWTEHFQVDVIDKRNEHLLEAIETSLLRYRTIVVPWGGLHLPGIQRGILARGFVLRESGNRRLLSYRTILTALSHRLRTP